MMPMYFEFLDTLHNFLFEGWNAQTVGVFVGSCIGIGFLTMALEGIKILKEYLNKRANLNPLTYAMTPSNVNTRSPLLAPLIIPPSINHIKRRKIYYHAVESVVYMLRMVVGYLAMLAVMSYNAWMGISVVIGSGLGYFIFFGLKSKFIDNMGVDSIDDQAETPLASSPQMMPAAQS